VEIFYDNGSGDVVWLERALHGGGRQEEYLNPVDMPLLHERTIQALLDGERSNVQIVGGNETPRAVIILSRKSFARYHRSSKATMCGFDLHWSSRRQFNRNAQANTIRPFNHGILVESIEVLGQNGSLQHALHSAINFRNFFDKKYL